MKTLFAYFTLLSALAVGTAPAADAQTTAPHRGNTLKAPSATPPPPVPPPVYTAPPRPGAGPVYVYEQKLQGSGRPYLIPPDQAQTIIERFKTEFRHPANPRIAIYINRELIDEKSGLKITSRKEKTKSTRSSTGTTNERISGENHYRLQEVSVPTLADRQTVRDLERLFGSPLRSAGARLVDQKTATQLLTDAPKSTDIGQAGKEREALSKQVDIALEVLVSSRNITVAEVSGDKTYAVPDIQATAVRLSDAQIIGQATAAEVIGRGRGTGFVARNYDVREIAEATCLLLMEEMVSAR